MEGPGLDGVYEHRDADVYAVKNDAKSKGTIRGALVIAATLCHLPVARYR